MLTWSLLHHLAAGIRHLALDLGLGLERPDARQTAWAVLIGAPELLLMQMLGGLLG